MSLTEVHPMRRCRWAVLFLVFSVLGCLAFGDADLLPPARSAPQAKQEIKAARNTEAKQVDILTVDRVELKAKYFPSGKANAPCVMLLHALGESSSDKEWTNFAK